MRSAESRYGMREVSHGKIDVKEIAEQQKYEKMKHLKIIIYLIFILFQAHSVKANPIKVKYISELKRLFCFENDSLLIENQYSSFSPDSQLCVILDKEKNYFTMYNYKKDVIRRIKYNTDSVQIVILANDQRYVPYRKAIISKYETNSTTTASVKNTKFLKLLFVFFPLILKKIFDHYFKNTFSIL